MNILLKNNLNSFLKYYNSFFEWCGLNEYELLGISKFDANNYIYPFEFKYYNELRFSLKKILKNYRETYNLEFKLLVSLVIFFDNEKLVNNYFKYLEEKHLIQIMKLALSTNCYETQFLLLTGSSEVKFRKKIIDTVYNSTKIIAIKSYTEFYILKKRSLQISNNYEIESFFKYYYYFFYWSQLTEESFLRGERGNTDLNKHIRKSAEWASDYPYMKQLNNSIRELLKSKKYDDSFLHSLAVSIIIDEEGENIADLAFEYLNNKQIYYLSKYSLDNQLFDLQRLLITRIYENKLPLNYIYFFLENTRFNYIKDYIINYVKIPPNDNIKGSNL